MIAQRSILLNWVLNVGWLWEEETGTRMRALNQLDRHECGLPLKTGHVTIMKKTSAQKFYYKNLKGREPDVLRILTNDYIGNEEDKRNGRTQWCSWIIRTPAIRSHLSCAEAKATRLIKIYVSSPNDKLSSALTWELPTKAFRQESMFLYTVASGSNVGGSAR